MPKLNSHLGRTELHFVFEILKLNSDGYKIKAQKVLYKLWFSQFNAFLLLLVAKGAANLVNHEGGGEEEECNNESSFQSSANENDASRVEFCPGGVQHITRTQSQDARQAVAALNTDRIQSTNNVATAPSNEDTEERMC